jgi:hypothetical protein
MFLAHGQESAVNHSFPSPTTTFQLSTSPSSPTLSSLVPKEFSPDEIAREITLMDCEFFKAISPLEFVGQQWNKTNKEMLAPNVVAWTQWFNKVINNLYSFLYH